MFYYFYNNYLKLNFALSRRHFHNQHLLKVRTLSKIIVPYNQITPNTSKTLPHSYTQHHFPALVILHDKVHIFLQLFQIVLL